MEALAETKSVYLEEFEGRGAAGPQWLSALHRRGIDAFEARGFPGPREEAWRKMKLRPVTDDHFRAVEAAGTVPQALAERLGDVGEGYRLVFVDGHFDAGLSDLDDLPAGLTVTPISAYSDAAPQRLAELLGARADIDGHPFAALNTAFFVDGAFVHAARGALVEKPVIVVHVTTPDADRRAVYPRLAVRVEPGAEVRVVERYIGDDQAGTLICPVSELAADEDAVLDYSRLQEDGIASMNIGTVNLAAARNTSVRGAFVGTGACIARLDLTADLEGPGGEIDCNGIYLTDGKQFQDYHNWFNHRAEHCYSRQRFKGILQGRSETVFDGLVKVFEGAQKTDAEQENRNLVLGKMALAHSNPRLEIFADDVRCTHGSTVGELDEQALFYLRTRGIGARGAKGMLTLAFAGEIVDMFKVPGVRDHVRRVLMERLAVEDASIGDIL
ncbi:Fe-S cluster assembly protein SufD [Sediminicurvatus halobius]|uniref:Fe-S cluster assembly protein SufD n=1 Tax=Sediminicurvatus halobius TaxID=2182432 RepID=A0A2U2N636_9GAMM|nr:Fe-S cluster assembly protein SufD [Spiribacter halobius]PWG64656.1 Fe-S cluster assembly protein SufD [Spiribacter halobius]UEX79020.1 Fe-S cluster assembly protein SufD [Spiribacter halobius]